MRILNVAKLQCTQMRRREETISTSVRQVFVTRPCRQSATAFYFKLCKNIGDFTVDLLEYGF